MQGVLLHLAIVETEPVQAPLQRDSCIAGSTGNTAAHQHLYSPEHLTHMISLILTTTLHSRDYYTHFIVRKHRLGQVETLL